MKVLVAQFSQESNSFCPLPCTLDSFRQCFYAYGSELYRELEHGSTEIAGALTCLREQQANVICSIAMNACSAGPVTKEAYKHFMKILLADIQANVPLDGVYLCMHGATILEDDDDGAGYVLECIRNTVGDAVPIAASLDYHANITDRMVRNANILRGYKTYPHVDLFEAGWEAADLLVRTIRGEIAPRMLSVRLPMIVQSENTQTVSGTMEQVAQMAKQAQTQKGMLSVSYFQVQPWMDVSDMGCTIIAIGDGDTASAERHAKELAGYFWESKESFKVELQTFDDVLQLAEQTAGLIVFSDAADAPSSGSTGDSNIFIKEYLQKNVAHKTYMLVVDPESVERAMRVGIGESVDFEIGGKINRDIYSPVRLRGKVTHLSDGSYYIYGDYAKGKQGNMGKSAVIQCKNLSILLISQAVFLSDPGPYLSMGLDPAHAKLVLVKSPNQFKSSFRQYTGQFIVVASPGASDSYFWNLPFHRLPKPMYPFEAVEYQPSVTAYGFYNEVSCDSVKRLNEKGYDL